VTLVNGQRQETFPTLMPVSDGGVLTIDLAANTSMNCEWYFHLPPM
jgi:hypothetical protein